MRKTLSRLFFLAGILAATLSPLLITPAHASTPTCQSMQYTSCSLNGSKRICVDATTGKTGACFCLDHVFDCAF